MKKRVLPIVLALCLCLGLASTAALADSTAYSDIQGHWAEDSILRWSEAGIVEGYGGSFLPDQALTRGQMAKILVGVLELTEEAGNPFADLPEDAWYTPYVLRCYRAGILLGDGINAYPDAVLTRQEAMTMLCRALGVELAEDAILVDYTDAGTVADWAVPYVAAMVRRGLVSGVEDDRLDPLGSMTRASILVVLDRAIPQGESDSGESDAPDESGGSDGSTASGGSSGSSGGSSSGGSGTSSGSSSGGGSSGGSSSGGGSGGGNSGSTDDNTGNDGDNTDNDGDNTDNDDDNTGDDDSNTDDTGEQEDGIIHLKGTEIDATGVEGVAVDGTIVTITAPGDYAIKGTLEDGQIVVSDALGKKDEVNITLLGVDVTCSDSAPFNAAGGKIEITLEDGTTNTFTDSGTYTADTTSKDPKGCFYARRDMDIGGSGTLVVNGNVKNGLVCGADLKIKKGASITVTAENNAIKGDNGVEFTGKTGTVTVIAGGDGIKSDAIDTDTVETGAIEAGKGYVVIGGGTFDITAEGDGIQADNYCTITGGNIAIKSGTEGIKANEVNLPVLEDDAVVEGEYVSGTVTVSGGTVTITAGEDGIKAAGLVEISGDAVVDITTDLDGIQSDDICIVSGGDITILAGGGNTKVINNDTESRKGIKAGTELTISGGDITIDSADDSLHSNYKVTITGGSMNLATGDDGVHADYTLTLGTEDGGDDDYTIDISTSYEGLEGSVINYLSGTTYLYATDDGVNAAGDYTEDGTLNPSGGSSSRPGGGWWGWDDSAPYGMLYIKGGRLYCEAEGDGLDSNGSIAMSGGIVLVNGPTRGANGVFDVGEENGGTFTVTGGTLIGAGTSSMAVTPKVTGQGVLQSRGNGSAGDPVQITTGSGSVTFVPKTTWQWFFATTPDMTAGESYSLSTVSSYGEEIFGRTVDGQFYGLAESK